jgi:hypothetical protein
MPKSTHPTLPYWLMLRIEIFDNHLNFHHHDDGERNSVSVLNGNPENGGPAEYRPAGEDPTHCVYTHGFEMTPNLESKGRVLLAEGSTVVGVRCFAFIPDERFEDQRYSQESVST